MKQSAEYTVQFEWEDEDYSASGWVSTSQERQSYGAAAISTTFCDVDVGEIMLLDNRRVLDDREWRGHNMEYYVRDKLEEAHNTAINEGAFEPDPDAEYDARREDR